jgi:hypothetical protein
MTRSIPLFVCWILGCAARAPSPVLSAPVAATPAARALTHSVFARDPQGQLGETAIQRILSAPLEVDFPGRVGLLPIVTAKDWRGPSPEYAHVPAGLGTLLASLRGTEHFTLMTEMMPIPSGALGMEALRETAARYQLRYVLLYREVVDKVRRVNPWSLGYLTVVGALFFPGTTLEVRGYSEASLFDVKTGLLLFTVRRGLFASRDSSLWYRADKLRRLQARAAARAAPELAREVRMALLRLAEAAELERKRRHAGGAPVGSVRGFRLPAGALDLAG